VGSAAGSAGSGSSSLTGHVGLVLDIVVAPCGSGVGVWSAADDGTLRRYALEWDGTLISPPHRESASTVAVPVPEGGGEGEGGGGGVAEVKDEA